MKVFLSILALFLAGCRPTTAQREARLVRGDGLPDIALAHQFAEVYPDAIHRLIWVGGTWEWIAAAGIHQRYEVKIVIPVEVGLFGHLKQNASPSFQVAEIEAVILTSQLNSKSYSKNQRRLSAGDWEKLRASKGDLKAIGFPVIATNPVKDFDAGLRMF